MPFKNRIRLPFYLSRPQFPVERNVFRKADGSSKLLSAVIRNTYEGKTDQLPEGWHRKLIIALAHKEVTVEGDNFLNDVVLDGEYAIEWQDFLNYPIAQADFTVQVTPFNASESNCQSCSEITQLNLVDDYTDTIWQEGTTNNEFPDIITANDTIYCFPFTIAIVSFNTIYFTSVTVDDDGVVTFSVAPSVPTLTDVLLATYRVTCANGQYDEANIYVNIEGTAVVCMPITNLQAEINEGDTNIYVTWTEPFPVPAGGYDWALYLTSNLSTPVQSGNVAGGTDTLTINGAALIEGHSYTLVFTSDCLSGDFSTPVSIVFNYASRVANSCGEFTVTYIPGVSEGIRSFSYMDCDGNVKTHTFYGAGIVTKCMLITPGTEVPIFYSADTADISILYNELC